MSDKRRCRKNRYRPRFYRDVIQQSHLIYQLISAILSEIAESRRVLPRRHSPRRDSSISLNVANIR